jgi:hypothetical protein
LFEDKKYTIFNKKTKKNLLDKETTKKIENLPNAHTNYEIPKNYINSLINKNKKINNHKYNFDNSGIFKYSSTILKNNKQYMGESMEHLGYFNKNNINLNSNVNFMSNIGGKFENINLNNEKILKGLVNFGAYDIDDFMDGNEL